MIDIHNGTIQVNKDPETHLFLFPDEPATLEQFQTTARRTVQNVAFFKGASRCMIEVISDIHIHEPFDRCPLSIYLLQCSVWRSS